MTQANDVAINAAAAHHGASLGSGENGGPARRRQLTAAKVFLTSQVPSGVVLTGTYHSCALAHRGVSIDPCATMRAPVSQRILRRPAVPSGRIVAFGVFAFDLETGELQSRGHNVR